MRIEYISSARINVLALAFLSVLSLQHSVLCKRPVKQTNKHNIGLNAIMYVLLLLSRFSVIYRIKKILKKSVKSPSVTDRELSKRVESNNP